MAPKESVAAPAVRPRGHSESMATAMLHRLMWHKNCPCSTFFSFLSHFRNVTSTWRANKARALESGGGKPKEKNRRNNRGKKRGFAPHAHVGALGIVILRSLAGQVRARVSEMSQKSRHPGRPLLGANCWKTREGWGRKRKEEKKDKSLRSMILPQSHVFLVSRTSPSPVT